MTETAPLFQCCRQGPPGLPGDIYKQAEGLLIDPESSKASRQKPRWGLWIASPCGSQWRFWVGTLFNDSMYQLTSGLYVASFYF
jgi:hypothetical protein